MERLEIFNNEKGFDFLDSFAYEYKQDKFRAKLRLIENICANIINDYNTEHVYNSLLKEIK